MGNRGYWGWQNSGQKERVAMKRYISYLKYILVHKWHTFRALPSLLGLLHDWSKFLPSEFFPYAKHFYNSDGTKRIWLESEGFQIAWLLHQRRNKHHWQYWILVEDSGNLKPLPIPDKYVKEMLADWYGAGMAHGTPDTAAWYSRNKDKMRLHVTARNWIEQQLKEEI